MCRVHFTLSIVVTDTIFVINSKHKNIYRKNKCKFFIKQKLRTNCKKLQIFLLKFVNLIKLHLRPQEISRKRFIFKTPLQKKIGFPKILIQEIVEDLEMELMFAQMKLFLPTSTAPATVARCHCPRAAAVASSLLTLCRVH